MRVKRYLLAMLYPLTQVSTLKSFSVDTDYISVFLISLYYIY